MCVDFVLLPENPSGYASAGDTEHDGPDGQREPGLGAGQDPNQRARGVLLHRVRVQCVVHVGNFGKFMVL